jgi:hypothetical protein
MAPGKTLNDAQLKALDEADSILERAFNEAAAKIRTVHEGDTGDSFGHCLRCSCGGFVAPTGTSAHSLKCQREGCGHLFPSHDVF